MEAFALQRNWNNGKFTLSFSKRAVFLQIDWLTGTTSSIQVEKSVYNVGSEQPAISKGMIAIEPPNTIKRRVPIPRILSGICHLYLHIFDNSA